MRFFVLLGLIAAFLAVTFAVAEEIETFKEKAIIPESCKEIYGGPSWRSSSEMYLEGYRRGFWQYIEKFAQDINYSYTLSDKAASGWGCFVGGWANGYDAAHREIQDNVKEFGLKRTHAKYKEIWNRVTGP
jgi:hypothetical protein